MTQVSQPLPTTSIATTARAVVVVQLPGDNTDSQEALLQSFEHALDHQIDLLRRTDRASLTRTHDLMELRCAVEYGPVRAAGDVRVQRLLQRELDDITTRAFGDGTTSAIFHIERRELSPDDLDTLVTSLLADADDVNLPLAIRQQRAKLAATIKQKARRTSGSGGPRAAHIDWAGTPHLAVIKMLAATIKTTEKPTRHGLWTRVNEMCEPVISAVLGEVGVTFADICKRHPDITVERLMGRADHTKRYGEYNDYRAAVERAYADLTNRPTTDSYDDDSVSEEALR